MTTAKLSKEQVTTLFNESLEKCKTETRIPQAMKGIAAVRLTCRKLLRAGVKDAGYACNLLGMNSDHMFERTGKSCKEVFTAAWNVTLNDARNQCFHRCIHETFGVSLEGIRGQGAKNIRFLIAAERNLDEVPELLQKANGESTKYAPTPVQWLKDNIGTEAGTSEKWEQFKTHFQNQLSRFTNLRVGRVDLFEVFEDEESF